MDKSNMLKTIGINCIEDLFSDIPKNLILKKLDIQNGMTEQEILVLLNKIIKKNKILTSFRGAGIYDHYIPSLVKEIIGRSEFWSSYTPYQAEASQGTLQSIFEYQSLICNLTDLDVSNASLYDGATAVVEAVLMSIRNNRKNKILISEALHPEYIKVIKTYLQNYKLHITLLETTNGVVGKNTLLAALDNNTAAVVVQSPNYFGLIEDMRTLCYNTKKIDTFFIAVVNPLSLGVFCTPGEYNADIAVGEGQILGLPMNCGGTTCGFIATKKPLAWKLPGRIVGQTKDSMGKRGFVLTMQSREQHIRRANATSNICTNASLNALANCVFLSGWGSDGLKKLAEINISKARYTLNKIKSIDGFNEKFKKQIFFNEFVVETTKDITRINNVLLQNKILGPIDLSNKYTNKLNNCLLFCVTEQRTKDEIDNLIEILKTI
jgi:glycine dehydrogenase subunit 1